MIIREQEMNSITTYEDLHTITISNTDMLISTCDSKNISKAPSVHINSLEEHLRNLADTLKECRAKFIEYELYHRNKGTADSLNKAAVNAEMISKINKALEM